MKVHAKGLLPYSFFFIAKITRIDRPSFMMIETQGDFCGLAEFRLTDRPAERCCSAELRWRVNINHPWIHLFVRHFRPIFVWNHRWAVNRLIRGLRGEINRKKGLSTIAYNQSPAFPHNIPFVRNYWSHRSKHLISLGDIGRPPTVDQR